MYQLKCFTPDKSREITAENQANEWLKKMSEKSSFKVISTSIAYNGGNTAIHMILCISYFVNP